jgi:hypothetical protein
MKLDINITPWETSNMAAMYTCEVGTTLAPFTIQYEVQ